MAAKWPQGLDNNDLNWPIDRLAPFRSDRKPLSQNFSNRPGSFSCFPAYGPPFAFTLRQMPHDVVRRRRESEVTNPLLEALMTLYMDVHETLPAGTTAADVAGAPAQDLLVQAEHGSNYRSYWVDPAAPPRGDLTMTRQSRRAGALAVVAALLAAACLGVAAPATADKPVTSQPKGGHKPGTIKFQHYFDTASTIISRDGSRQTGRFSGVIHLGGEVILDADGQPSEIDIHANVSDAVATIPGTGDSRPVTGSVRFDDHPQICVPRDLCGPIPWQLTFALAGGPDGSAGRDLAVLRVAATFDDSWNLVDVQPVTGGLE